MNQTTKPLSAGRVAGGCLLAYLALILSQVVALLLGQMAGGGGTPSAVGSLVSALVYLALTLVFLGLVGKKLLGLTLGECRLTGAKPLHPLWGAAALGMPGLVILLAMLSGGHWQVADMDGGMLAYTLTDALLYYGLATGVAEEVLFRGVIMTALEKRWNRGVAIVVPSVLFALSHLIGTRLDLLSALQLLAAGTLVGVLFSLVAYVSGSLWNSVLLHGVWNAVLVGGLVHIGPEASDLFLVNYVQKSTHFAVTGGDFGIEASLFALLAYALAILAALVQGKRRPRPSLPRD